MREKSEVITATKKGNSNNFKLFSVHLQYSHHFVVANDFDGNVLVPTSSIPGPYNVTEHPLASVAIHSVAFFQQLSNSHTCQQKSYCPWTLPSQCRHAQYSFFPAALTPVNRNHTGTEHSLASVFLAAPQFSHLIFSTEVTLLLNTHSLACRATQYVKLFQYFSRTNFSWRGKVNSNLKTLFYKDCSKERVSVVKRKKKTLCVCVCVCVTLCMYLRMHVYVYWLSHGCDLNRYSNDTYDSNPLHHPSCRWGLDSLSPLSSHASTPDSVQLKHK